MYVRVIQGISTDLLEIGKKCNGSTVNVDCVDDDQQLVLMAYKARPELLPCM